MARRAVSGTAGFGLTDSITTAPSPNTRPSRRATSRRCRATSTSRRAQPADLGPDCVAGTIRARRLRAGQRHRARRRRRGRVDGDAIRRLAAPTSSAADAPATVRRRSTTARRVRRPRERRLRRRRRHRFGARCHRRRHREAIRAPGSSGGTWCPSSGRPRRAPSTAWRSTSLSIRSCQLSEIVQRVRNGRLRRTSAPSRPWTMLSPPLTRPSRSRGRRSSTFVRRDSLTRLRFLGTTTRHLRDRPHQKRTMQERRIRPAWNISASPEPRT